MRIDVPISVEERKERFASIPRLERLAELGDVKSQINLAWEYAEGQIIDADFGKAGRLFEQAAASESEEALLFNARFLQLRRVPKGMREIREFAKSGNFKAQFWMARYYQGYAGRISQLRAAVWFKRSHKNGSIGAKAGLLGQCFRLAPFYKKPILIAQVLILLFRILASQDKLNEETSGHLFTKLKRR